MKAQFLTEKQLVQKYWQQLVPLFQPVVEKATHGEFTLDDLYRLAMNGNIHIGIAKENNEIVMAVAFEFRQYPQKLAVNVLAMGGKKQKEVMSRFLETFGKWAASAGADWIEAYCSHAMARLQARSGFVTTYQLLRLDLSKEGE